MKKYEVYVVVGSLYRAFYTLYTSPNLGLLASRLFPQKLRGHGTRDRVDKACPATPAIPAEAARSGGLEDF